MKHTQTNKYISRSVLVACKTEQQLKAVLPGKQRTGAYIKALDAYKVVFVDR